MAATTAATTAAQLLNGLNDAQREAVTAAPDGVLVVLAGPGSGTCRARHVHSGRSP